MNINITVLTCLQFIAVHKEFSVKFLIQFVKDQASLCSYKCTVCIGITLVSDITDCLTLGIYIIHHMDEIKFVIAVITITLGNCRVYTLQSAFYDIVHFLDLNLVFAEGICMLLRKTADKIPLLLRKCIKNSCS